MLGRMDGRKDSLTYTTRTVTARVNSIVHVPRYELRVFVSDVRTMLTRITNIAATIGRCYSLHTRM